MSSTIKLLQVVFLAVLAVCVKAQYNDLIPEVDQRCMECLCYAGSHCDLTLKCHNPGGGNYYCGPYVISWAYWHEGGRPGDYGGPHDFETCLNNKTCAEQAVRGYMRVYGKDCDRSGTIDCYDFVRIHKLGAAGCKSDSILNTQFWKNFESCYGSFNNNNVMHSDQYW
ncbi:Lysozyme 3 like protein [Argiope bruennichi]|uniref:lysozyme n=1 Tax=Argiope bruennichi TaxID=94029 RepID=A0A8T0EZ60_ARGBR|nr:Lysozyme 3 like protein [Argiope bruennichi]